MLKKTLNTISSPKLKAIMKDYDNQNRDLKAMVIVKLRNAIISDPSLALEFDNLNLWDKFDEHDWSEILSIHPQFADRCNKWAEFSAFMWLEILRFHPQFANRCINWEHLVSYYDCSSSIAYCLSFQPQLIEKLKGCNYFLGKIEKEDWVYLLKCRPELIENCTKLQRFSSTEWSDILSVQPQLWVYSSGKTAEKIIENPNKINESKCVNRIKANAWSEILSYHPELADRCKKWRFFSGMNCYNLLKVQPQFADKCPDCAYDQFTKEQWDELETKNPEVFSNRRMLSTLRKLAKN